jgi:intein-encoded DNA endonuclease-like protein
MSSQFWNGIQKRSDLYSIIQGFHREIKSMHEIYDTDYLKSLTDSEVSTRDEIVADMNALIEKIEVLRATYPKLDHDLT